MFASDEFYQSISDWRRSIDLHTDSSPLLKIAGFAYRKIATRTEAVRATTLVKAEEATPDELLKVCRALLYHHT